ncbi:MAG: UDP-N-acetylmuramoyl-tripeptide--D-alanyl-D-alanine ligase [Candidatus Adiutrix sp.]|nr:UDP-N-acetylmuramoyl-tripeptide--D-alanyl-D-alanine ligase [Candidatus Adiutrix sp.]
MKTLGLKLDWILENAGTLSSGKDLSRLTAQGVKGLSTDSRTIRPGEIFVALTGPRFDGHDHAAQALAKGALAVVVQRGLTGEAGPKSIHVADTLKALGDLAGSLRRCRPLRVVAVTGSNGKTTTKEMLAAILKLEDRHLLATAGNFNNLIGLPLTLARLDRKTRIAVLEMGMSAAGEIARLTSIAEPDVALITSIGPAHLEFFGTVARVAKAKGELFAGLKEDALAVVNDDDPWLPAEAARFGGNRLYFGSTARSNIRLGRVEPRSLSSQSLTIYGPGAAGGRRVELKLPGRHNAQNALAAAAAALGAGVNWDRIQQGLEAVRGFPGRLDPFQTNGGLWVLDDSYNANPASMTAGLSVLAGFKTSGRRGAILGDMLELGVNGKSLHRHIGRLAVNLGLDYLALVGPLSVCTARAARRAGLPSSATREFAAPEEAAAWVLAEWPRGAVLVKGSRGISLERAVEYLRVNGGTRPSVKTEFETRLG